MFVFIYTKALNIQTHTNLHIQTKLYNTLSSYIQAQLYNISLSMEVSSHHPIGFT